MIYRISFTLLLLTGLTSLLSAQSSTHPLNEFFDSFRSKQYENAPGEKADYTGSPYENNDFVEGEIYTIRQEHFDSIPLRYNIYQDKMEFRKPTGEIFNIDPPEFADTVVIKGSKYIYYPFRTGGRTSKGFFKMITNGQPVLLGKLNVTFRAGELPGGYKDAVPASFVRMDDDYYLAEIPGDAVKIDGKKGILELLSGHAKELEQFMKQNRTRTGKEDDLKKLMEFYYSLAK
jgi:hypothetical protein